MKNYQYISISSPVHTKSNGSFRVNAAGNALLFTFHLQHRFIRFCSFGYILSDMFLVRSVLSSVYLPPLVQVMFCLQSYLYFVYGSIYVLCKLCSVASVPSMAWPMSTVLGFGYVPPLIHIQFLICSGYVSAMFQQLCSLIKMMTEETTRDKNTKKACCIWAFYF